MVESLQKDSPTSGGKVEVRYSIPIEIHTAFKAACVVQQQSMGDVVIQLMRDYITKEAA